MLLEHHGYEYGDCADADWISPSSAAAISKNIDRRIEVSRLPPDPTLSNCATKVLWRANRSNGAVRHSAGPRGEHPGNAWRYQHGNLERPSNVATQASTFASGQAGDGPFAF
jgi:hypothetical protein